MQNSKKSEPQHKKHSDFSASASERWRNCPGSVKKTRGLESEDSQASLQGTAAHELAAAALLARVCPTKLRVRGKVPDEYLEFIDDEMRFEIKKYFDHIIPFFDRGEVYIETKFDLSHLNSKKLVHYDTIEKGEFAPNGKFTMFGTGDVVVLEPFGDLHVIDLKYGKGKMVAAENNSQLAFYGLGGGDLAGWECAEAHLSIFQPRRDHFPVWSMAASELKAWQKTFKDAIWKAVAKDPELNPGDHCGFCPAKETCEARNSQMDRQLQTQFADPNPPKVKSPAKLLPEQISQVLDAGKGIEEWLKSVRAEALKRLENGIEIPGYKLVSRKGDRVWKLPNQVSSFCKRQGYEDMFTTPALKSPAQAEKILGKTFVKKHAVHAASGRTLARGNDLREKLVSKLQSDFED